MGGSPMVKDFSKQLYYFLCQRQLVFCLESHSGLTWESGKWEYIQGLKTLAF